LLLIEATTLRKAAGAAFEISPIATSNHWLKTQPGNVLSLTKED
jgi:hypothetical protein